MNLREAVPHLPQPGLFRRTLDGLKRRWTHPYRFAMHGNCCTLWMWRDGDLTFAHPRPIEELPAMLAAIRRVKPGESWAFNRNAVVPTQWVVQVRAEMEAAHARRLEQGLT